MKLNFKKFIKPGSGEDKPGLDTFSGVFTPSILTILGVIMYLRFGWVVGNVGLIGTLIIVTLSTLITFLTALSIASIATDQQVKTGGAYYMISRSLGLESGGAIGIPLFLAQTFSIALYTIGFAESVSTVFPGLDQTLVGIVVTILIAVLAFISAKAAIKSQFFVMAAIGISLLSLLLGKPLENTDIEMWGVPESKSEGFWTVFAVFFPAVTGIMAGVNMSGDLRNPGKSIPKGTFMAVGVGYIIYMLLPILLAGRADAATLVEDSLIMRKISFWGDAILLGVWGATLSSAIGSILGAPRVLQALARDNILPRWLKWLGKGSGQEDNPRVGIVFTLGLALAAVYFGNLNLIAPILTMFFLTTYGVLNISAGLERFLGSPSFRPKFKVHWFFSLLGAVGCLGVMLLINPLATAIASAFVFLVYSWLERRNLKTTWGDVRQGIWMAFVRSGVFRFRTANDPKNWRPHMLVLTGAPTKRWHLIHFARSLSHNKSLMTISTILPEASINPSRKSKMEENIREFLIQRNVQSLVRVIAAPDPFKGAELLVESYGLGALMPDTILLGDTREPTHRQAYCNMIYHFFLSKRNVLILRDNEEQGFGKFSKIDIWWGGLKRNGALMIIIAYLLQNSHEWNQAEVTLKMVVPSETAATDAQDNVNQLLEKIRIDLKKEIIVNNGRNFDQILHTSSGQTDLVLMGMAEPDANFESYYDKLCKRVEKLPATLFVLASQDIVFEEVLLKNS
ncbi:MAG: Na-K-Cl cotransporter [Candidatus Cyclobacteriaceae bacterium M3_2C_046]